MALTAFLERHPEIKRVTLYMDNDLAALPMPGKSKPCSIRISVLSTYG